MLHARAALITAYAGFVLIHLLSCPRDCGVDAASMMLLAALITASALLFWELLLQSTRHGRCRLHPPAAIAVYSGRWYCGGDSGLKGRANAWRLVMEQVPCLLRQSFYISTSSWDALN
jgi:hypothetical protein